MRGKQQRSASGTEQGLTGQGKDLRGKQEDLEPRVHTLHLFFGNSNHMSMHRKEIDKLTPYSS